MIDETDPEAPDLSQPPDLTQPTPPPPTFEEWQERFEKCFQFQGMETPAVEVPVLIGYFDEGFTPFQAFELLTNPPA